MEYVSWHIVQRRFGLPGESISESELDVVVTVSLWEGVGEAISKSGESRSDDSEIIHDRMLETYPTNRPKHLFVSAYFTHIDTVK